MANGQCYRRWWKECPTKCLPLCLPCNGLFHPCRKAVSKDKNRYEEGSFSLDLVYLFPRLIICGFPSAGLEHMYRNPRLEIKRFLEERHPGNYFVFNFVLNLDGVIRTKFLKIEFDAFLTKTTTSHTRKCYQGFCILQKNGLTQTQNILLCCIAKPAKAELE